MCSREDILQERIFFVIKNYRISAAPNRPAEGCSTYKDKWFVIFWYTIQPISKHIRYTTWFRQSPSRVDQAHTNRVKRQSRKRCCIVSSSWQRQHCWLSCQLHLARLFFVSMTLRFRYHRKILILSGILSFHIFLFVFEMLWCISPYMTLGSIFIPQLAWCGCCTTILAWYIVIKKILAWYMYVDIGKST